MYTCKICGKEVLALITAPVQYAPDQQGLLWPIGQWAPPTLREILVSCEDDHEGPLTGWEPQWDESMDAWRLVPVKIEKGGGA